ncbi:hypothetical protein [Actinoplanes sp. GCM10030250]|uniref:hypothetical protein n=1 Tax=Actinoplanes sp. GCM10030250 TaxID=3273376 RepID=UPI00360C177B
MSLDEHRELNRLRLRVRASRWATSGPLLVFGVTTMVFAGYLAAVHYYFVPAPLFWPLCSLLALLVLWGIDRIRRGRTGVGEGRLSYGKTAAVLLAVIVAGNLIWFYPLTKMLLWPGTVLTIMALRQRNKPLARRSGIIGGLMIAGWFAGSLVTADWYDPLMMGCGGLAMTAAGAVERQRERKING